MKLLQIKHIQNQSVRQQVIDEFLSSETDSILRDFVSSISGFRPHVFHKMLEWYIDETTTTPIHELEVGTIFEFDDTTYQFAGVIDLTPYYNRLGSKELVTLPVTEETRVRRVF